MEIDRNSPVTTPAARNSVNRYLYNEKELQVGTGYVDYGARMYMPEIGRWSVPDPMLNKYYMESPYNYVLNRPTIAVDPDGMDVIFIVRGKDGGKDRSLTYKNGNATWNDTGKRYDGTGANNTIFRILKAYQKIEKSNDDNLKKQLNSLVQSEKRHFVEENAGGLNGVKGDGNRDKDGREGSQAFFNFSEQESNEFEGTTGVPNSDLSTVAHEMRHQHDHEIGNTSDNEDINSTRDPSEIRAVNNENRARKIEGLPLRTKYGKDKIDPKKLQNPPNNY